MIGILPDFVLIKSLVSLVAGADGSYDELLHDDDVEIVYVGNVHSFRRSIGERCLKANKHVLLEKPFACSTEDAEHLVALAKQRNLFLMEVRLFPLRMEDTYQIKSI